MENITSTIKVAISKNIIWSVNFFFSTVERIEEIGFKISFWEGEENWASILADDKIIGYIWKKYPLIFILAQYSDEIKDNLKDYDYITIVEVKSLIDKEFKINYDELKGEIDFGLCYDGFSIEDLWFHTNSI